LVDDILDVLAASPAGETFAALFWTVLFAWQSRSRIQVEKSRLPPHCSHGGGHGL